MNAYNETYIDDAMDNLGEMLDFAVNDCGYELEEFYELFCYSNVGRQFERGNPRYVAGMSGVELMRAVIHEIKGEWISVPYMGVIERNELYWTGWVLAYYQWLRNMTFSEMIEYGLTADYVVAHYLLHEADISKFVDVADSLIESYKRRI